LSMNLQLNEQKSMLLIIIHYNPFKYDYHKGIKTIEKDCRAKLKIRRIIRSYTEIEQTNIRNQLSIQTVKVMSKTYIMHFHCSKNREKKKH